MKNFYTLLLASLLLLFSTSNVLAQTGPCSLSGASNYIDFTSSPTIMMNVSVNGMSQYSYGWNDGTPVGSSNQKPFYSGWCVTITDLMTGCDTTICESCIPTGGVGICSFIYDPVCGCDGNIYDNDCMAMNNEIFTYTSTLGGTLPCVVPLPSWDCVNGACLDPLTGNGQYPNLNDCLLDSCIVIPPVPSWDCVNGACLDPLTGNGQYPNLNDCLLDSCIVTPPVPSWDCFLGLCKDLGTGMGVYSDSLVCVASCVVVTPSWDCFSGMCKDLGTGMGVYSDSLVCVASCVVVTPSWDCFSGMCKDLGTGMGVYSDSLVCVAACIVNAVEEQNISKRLLKVIDFLGREEKGGKNEVLFYIYDDGTVEKKIVIE